MKVVINATYGGFSVSRAVYEFLNLPIQPYGFTDETGEKWNRTDPRLIAAVEALGKKASGDCASLKIVEIPDDVKWVIEEYDGSEWVAEVHRTWD